MNLRNLKMTDIVDELVIEIEQMQSPNGLVDADMVIDLLYQRRNEIYDMEQEQALRTVDNLLDYRINQFIEAQENATIARGAIQAEQEFTV